MFVRLWRDMPRTGPAAPCHQRYHLCMPAPTTERQVLERERDELPSHVTNYRRELDATPQENRERRERLEWQIRRVEKRMAEVHARLVAAGR